MVDTLDKADRVKARARMTAYASNTRAGAAPSMRAAPGWAEKINRLLRDHYCFTALKYSGPGVLFRGMSSGLADALRNGRFGRYADDKPHAELEQELDVLFVSHDLSDALSCARLWESVDDAGILVIDAAYFNAEYDWRNAAMMNFAEPGVVFNYPLLCEAIEARQVQTLYVNTTTAARLRALALDSAALRIVAIEDDDRACMEQAIRADLALHDMRAAVPVPADTWPGQAR